MTKSEKLNNALLRADLWRVPALAFSSPTEDTLADLQGLCRELASALDPEQYPIQAGLVELADGGCPAERSCSFPGEPVHLCSRCVHRFVEGPLAIPRVPRAQHF